MNEAVQDRREPWPFYKMHGLGNDFVILDLRRRPQDGPDGDVVRRIAHRRRGLGCDQLVVLRDGDDQSVVAMEIWNADGTRAGACGNATRCVARLLAEESGRRHLVIRVGERLLAAEIIADGAQVAVDMGAPAFDWRAIPLSRDVPADPLPLAFAELPAAAAVSVGNPHVVFFVPELRGLPLARIGEEVNDDPLLPEGANVSLAAVRGSDRLELRVFERGVGLTPACGSAACAAAVAAARRGLVERRVRVEQAGGDLEIDWREDDHVWMRGPASRVAEGVLAPELVMAPQEEEAP
ncbi:MAG: diaminopimelate epimerase [Alphaproteobacteria bacterium]|nr:MAG: diaminopimelate epimerase [Alphaproteobacteria bacterium]